MSDKNDKFKTQETILDHLPEHEKSRVEANEHSTTGHEWDGIKEFDKPIPRWWMWTYILSIVFAIGYMIAYPAIPLVNDYTKGLLNWSSRDAVEQQISEAKLAQSVYIDALNITALDDVAGNEELMIFAVEGGKSAYAVNCVQCHGSGAIGSKGYPNLNDDEWLWGGTLEEIYTTISHGIRFDEDEDSRYSEMPAFLTDEMLAKDEIAQVAHFVRSFTGLEHNAADAALGAVIFEDNCAGCHGDTGAGDKDQGAPNLADAVWLYGADQQTLVNTISTGRKGVMPAWAHRLDDTVLKQLTLFVHSRGGGL
ncbi:MAG: cytochrome-c oxidase, cbb3-type subunit III [Rhizobiales bacterium]|nr:cytochrome-c oxidase, cbb3-type subunit III [Hyphomicrobiales bacterium]NRB15292.1 cytochrome-c oxidase, cbb3-type subunit III [Hyphomicrobiales bacterium]